MYDPRGEVRDSSTLYQCQPSAELMQGKLAAHGEGTGSVAFKTQID